MALNEEQRAELVAYLDGELDEEATLAVEAKVAADPDTRAELNELKQTWGLLDYLPKASPSPNFTHRTLERLTLENLPAQKTMPMPGRHRAWLAAAGWAGSAIWRPRTSGRRGRRSPFPIPTRSCAICALPSNGVCWRTRMIWISSSN
jgi:anti-sigma factor RsiW